jgi:hypothetical protein
MLTLLPALRLKRRASNDDALQVKCTIDRSM